MRHYEVLGLQPTATPRQIRTAYLALARRYHPDTGGSEAAMREINEAWTVLGHPTRRQAYDASLGRTGKPGWTTDPPPFRASSSDIDIDDHDVLFTPQRAASPLTIVPVALFAASIGSYCVGVVTTLEHFVGLAFMLFCLSALLMVAMPFLELARGRRAARR